MTDHGRKREPWALGISLVIVVFMLGLAGMAGFLLTRDVNLVTENYYEKDLKFEDQLARINRGRQLRDPPVLTYESDETLALRFPPGMLTDNYSGAVQIYRPADHNADVLLPLKLTGDTLQVIDFQDQPRGLWRWKLNWTEGGLEYYLENSFFVH